jgi:hypothetical protein
MQRQEAGPAVVLYPPIDDDDREEVGIASRASALSDVSRSNSSFFYPNGQGSLADDDDIVSSDCRRRRDGEGSAAPAPPVPTQGARSRSAGVVRSESIEAGGSHQKAKSGGSGAAACARHMSHDLATKFEALKRRKANGDAIEDCHVALAEEALGMASAEIARMQRACAELEGRLGADPQPPPLPPPQQRRHVRNPDGGRDPGRRGAARRQDADNNEEEFPVLLPRVVVITSSDHSRSSSLDANDVDPDLDDHLLEFDDSNQDDDPAGSGSGCVP